MDDHKPQPIMEREQFAFYMERRLSLYDDEVAIVARDELALTVSANGRELTIDLDPFYEAYARRPQQIDVVVKTLLGVARGIPAVREARDFAVVAAQVRPMLKPVALLLDVRERGVPLPVYREFMADLIITYVIHETNRAAYITDDHLRRWGINAAQLHARAVQNLQRVTDGVQSVTSGVGDQRLFMFNSGDGYDATRLLLTDVLAGWAAKVPGNLVVGVPERDFLIAFSDANQDILRAISAQIAADAVSKAHGLTEQLFTLARGTISVYEWE